MRALRVQLHGRHETVVPEFQVANSLIFHLFFQVHPFDLDIVEFFRMGQVLVFQFQACGKQIDYERIDHVLVRGDLQMGDD